MNDDERLALYVRSIADGFRERLAALEVLRELSGSTLGELDPEPGTSREGSSDRHAVETARDRLELDQVDDDVDVADGVDDYRLLEGALEVRAEGYRSGDEWTVERVRVLLAFGGPNVYLYSDGARAWLDGRWGGSRVEGVRVDDDAAAAIAGELGYLFD